jgi:hypothetical protein
MIARYRRGLLVAGCVLLATSFDARAQQPSEAAAIAVKTPFEGATGTMARPQKEAAARPSRDLTADTPGVETIPAVAQNATIQEIRQQLAALNNERTRLLQMYTSNHPDLIRNSKQIDIATGRLRAETNKVLDSLRSDSRTVFVEGVPYTKAGEPIGRRGFNVVLLLGDMLGPGYPKVIPDAALKALADMRDFLPYKGYNLLDTQWIIAGTSSPAVTRLRGLDDQEYELELRASPTMMPGTAAPNPANIAVRFVLRDATESSGADSKLSPFHPAALEKADATSLEISRQVFELERERDDLQIQVTKKRSQVEVGTADPGEVTRMQTQLTAVLRRIAELKKLMTETASKRTGRPVIDTSFRMDDGETVVVGTSKVKGGGKALIALLTATADRPAKGSSK